MAEGVCKVGKRLIRIKAHEGHGKFLEALTRLEIEPRFAQFAMPAARKFSNTITGSYLGNSKIRALSVLEEDDIKILESGGKVRGMTLDDIDRMSVRELRGNLRKSKEEVNAEKEARKRDREMQEKAIAQKEAKINELDARLRYQPPLTAEQRAQNQLDEQITEYRMALLEAIGSLQKAVTLFTRMEGIEGVQVQQLNEWFNQFDPEMRLLDEVRQELIAMVDEPRVIKPFSIRDGAEGVPDVC
ncbi:MAG: hypothetical protein LBG24_10000 [Treponema sp.]|jgi:hypothetical protein|nr:hypothetical protein [Treponema sp.]